jgi:predicted DNA binding CopG/RHH family protein
MAIEIISKPKTKKFTWAKILLTIDVVLILASGGIYLYLNISSKQTSKKINEERDEISLLVSSNKELEKKALFYEKKINDFSKLFSEHQETSKIFTFLEKKTHPNIRFSKFDFSADKLSVTVSGEAKSFIDVGQQLLILKEEKSLKNINLSGLSLGEKGGVLFSLQLTFDSQVFK